MKVSVIMYPSSKPEYRHKKYLENKEENNQISRNYYKTHRNQLLQDQHERNQKVKLRVLTFYSGGLPKCGCCNESCLDFLTMDHINGGGTQHRINQIKGASLHRWLIKNNFPVGFQVLCFNCNCGRGLKQNKGVCPHAI